MFTYSRRSTNHSPVEVPDADDAFGQIVWAEMPWFFGEFSYTVYATVGDDLVLVNAGSSDTDIAQLEGNANQVVVALK